MPAASTLQFYSPEELKAIEAGADNVNSKAGAGMLPPECYHVTAGKSGSAKRTKFFFGARYLWTREQMSSIASARRAHGVRVDVPAIPPWVQVSPWPLLPYSHMHLGQTSLRGSSLITPANRPSIQWLLRRASGSSAGCERKAGGAWPGSDRMHRSKHSRSACHKALHNCTLHRPNLQSIICSGDAELTASLVHDIIDCLDL